MSSNIDVEPGAAPESVLVSTDSCENFQQMSSSLEEIKNTNALVQCDESTESTCNDNLDESTNSNEDTCDESETENSSEWTSKKKHVFVLSLAGKPIYSR